MLHIAYCAAFASTQLLPTQLQRNSNHHQAHFVTVLQVLKKMRIICRWQLLAAPPPPPPHTPLPAAAAAATTAAAAQNQYQHSPTPTLNRNTA